MRSFGRFLRVTITAGFAVAGTLAVLVPIAAFAVTSLGSGIQLQPLTVRAVSEPSTVYDDCNPAPGPGHCGPNDVIATLSYSDYSQPVTNLADVPAVVIKAVLDAEDRNFWVHGPIDIPSIIRAASRDVSSHGIVQGGSTITQQLVKNEVLTPKRTFARKITELIDSYRLFNKWSRSQILLQYLNTVYFGYGAYGIKAAANVYYQKTLDQLDVADAAFLAGLIRNPSYADPIHLPTNAEDRRNEVIRQMVSDHNLSPTVTSQEGQFYEAVPVTSKVTPPSQQTYSPFVTEVVQYLLADPALGATPTLRFNQVFKGGLQIYTTYDPALQAEANSAVLKILPDTGGKYTAALVAMNPLNGFVEALVPGNPASNQGYDVATGYGGSGRQPGSSYKGIVMAAALENGFSPYDSVDGTSPCTFILPGAQKPYIAHNAEPGYGVMSIQTALTDSVNCAFIRIGLAVGDEKIASQAQAMGINNPLGINSSLPGSSSNPLLAVPSIAIGSEDATPLEMASAYATIDEGGVYHTPVFVKKVYASSTAGSQLLVNNADKQGHQAMPATDAEIETQMLQQVVEYGTGTAAALSDRPVAGKTGTTDNLQDAWFTGYTPQLVTSVWMGDPAGEVSMWDVGGVAVFGGTYPAEIWRAFMSQAMGGQPVEQFRPPPNGSIPAGGRLIGCTGDVNYSGDLGSYPTYPIAIGGTVPTTCTLGGNGGYYYDTTTTMSTDLTSTTGSSSSTSPTLSSTTTVASGSSTTSVPTSSTVTATTKPQPPSTLPPLSTTSSTG